MFLRLEPSLREKFPGLAARMVYLKDAVVTKEDPELEAYKKEALQQVQGQWTAEELKEHPVFRAYRDFFWRLGVDPTKTRPASEALIRRSLRGKPIPKINTFVDAYNLASMLTLVPLAAFDVDQMVGDPLMREAAEGETFRGIGMDKDIVLKGGEVVVEDGEKLIAVYPYRDADSSKVTFDTTNVLMLICGAPKISAGMLAEAEKTTVEIVTRFCGGSVS